MQAHKMKNWFLLFLLVVILRANYCSLAQWNKNISHNKSQALNFLQGESGPSYFYIYYFNEHQLTQLRVYFMDRCQAPTKIINLVVHLHAEQRQNLSELKNVKVDWSYQYPNEAQLTEYQSSLNYQNYSIFFEQYKRIVIYSDNQVLFSLNFNKDQYVKYQNLNIVQIYIVIGILLCVFLSMLLAICFLRIQDYKELGIRPINFQILTLIFGNFIHTYRWNYNYFREGIAIIFCLLLSFLFSSLLHVAFCLKIRFTLVRAGIIILLGFMIAFDWLSSSFIPFIILSLELLDFIQLLYNLQEEVPYSKSVILVLLELLILYVYLFIRLEEDYLKNILNVTLVIQLFILFLVQAKSLRLYVGKCLKGIQKKKLHQKKSNQRYEQDQKMPKMESQFRLGYVDKSFDRIERHEEMSKVNQ